MATLAPAAYYKDLCGLPDARAVALKSPFPPENFGLFAACQVSTRYRDREGSIAQVAGCLAAMAAGALLLSLAGGRRADAPAKRRGAARRRKTG